MEGPVLVVGNRRATAKFRLYADRLEHEKLGKRAALLPLVAITDVYATGPAAATLVVRGIGGETHEIGDVGPLDCEDLRSAIARLRSGEDPRAVAQSFANTERGRGRRALRFSLAAVAVLVLTLLAAGQLFTSLPAG
jgi:hypothetical protein